MTKRHVYYIDEADDEINTFRCEECGREHSSYCKTARFCSKVCNKRAYWTRRFAKLDLAKEQAKKTK